MAIKLPTASHTSFCKHHQPQSEDGGAARSPDPWQHDSLSLQERLGLTDQEVDRLRLSPRSGLAVQVNVDVDEGVAFEAGVPGRVGDGNSGGGGGIGGGGGGGGDGAAEGGGDTFFGEYDVPGGGDDSGGGISGVSVSPRSGVVGYGGEAAAAAAAAAAASRLRDKMTGRSAGGPHTAVGYLLGELRMRPDEVRVFRGMCPAMRTCHLTRPHSGVHYHFFSS